MFKHRTFGKRLVSLLTACCTALTAAVTLPAISASAESGSCGDNASWSLTDGVLTISGSGAVTSTGWSSLKSSVKSVVVENGITSLPNNAFSTYTAMTSLKLADSVTTVGTGLCLSCTALKTLTLSANLTEIPASAFYSCSALNDLTLPAKTTAIGANAFALCLGLKAIDIPDSVKTIGNLAFYGNNATSLTLGSSVETIGANAFNYSCFASVEIPDSVTSIGSTAFGIVCSQVSLQSGMISYLYDEPLTYVTLYGTPGGAAQTFAESGKCTFAPTGTVVHTHTWSDWKTSTAPTCTEEGQNVRECTGCGEKEYQTVPATGHSWSDWTVVKAPTLDSEGTESRTCANCGETETRGIPALTGYNITATAGAGGSISPSGTTRVAENDSITFTITADDGYEISDVTLDSTSLGAVGSYTLKNITADHQIFATFKQIEQQHGEDDHVWSAWTVETAATCIADGKMVRTCTICGENEYQSIPATGHTWGEWTTFTPATCTENGQRVRECTSCGEKEYQDIPATGHSWSDWRVLTAATCTENGQNVRECANCGKKEYQDVPATGHAWSDWKVVREPALDEEGLETRTCANCGETESRAIPALTGYTITASAGIGGSISPSGSVRVEAGKSMKFTITPDEGYEIASVTVDNTDLGTVGSYTFSNVTTDHQIFAAFKQIEQQHGENDHVWSDWTVETAASCTADGRMIRTCTICGEAQYQSIPALGHDWGEWTESKRATCTEDGQNVRVCTRCGEVEYQSVPATGHSWGSWHEFTAPTCTEEGQNVRICTNCGEAEYQSVPATGHNWTDWKVVQPATVNEEGLEMRTCLNCGETETRTIAKLEARDFTISASSGEGGSVSPSGDTVVKEGSSQTFTFRARRNYEVEDVLIDGASVGAVTEYTFTNISANHTVYVSFKQQAEDPPQTTKVCTGLYLLPQRHAFFTDETAFKQGDFVVMAKFEENGTETTVDITADFTFGSSPYEIANAGQYGEVKYSPTYKGSDSVVATYLTQNGLSAKITVCLLGDANLNKQIDAGDSMYALRAYAASITFLDSPISATEEEIVDVDHDGTITLIDSMAILRYFSYDMIGLSPTWDSVIKR